jgi:hypothetical protein
VVTDTVDLLGAIGTRLLGGLLGARRLRVSTRKVKSPISRYHARQDDGRPATSNQPQGTHPGPASQRPRAPLARP